MMDESGKGSMVLIEWLDSRGVSNGWEFRKEYKREGACLCKSLGWVLDDDGDSVALAGHVADQGDDQQVIGIMEIPKCAIQSITKLRASE